MSAIDIINEKIRKYEERIIDIQPREEYIEELYQIKEELEDYQFLKKLHNQMREEMEREYCACEKMAYDNLIANIKDSYWHWTGRASCYRDLLDYYDEDWSKENVRNDK